MGTPAVGTVILIPFPFGDYSRVKIRPALVVARAEFEDVILCSITSKHTAGKARISLTDADFDSGGLNLDSYIRPDKLFTLESRLILRDIGIVNKSKLDETFKTLRSLFS